MISIGVDAFVYLDLQKTSLVHGGMFEEQQCRRRTTKLTQRKDNKKRFLRWCGLFLLFRVLRFGPFSSFIAFL